MLGAAGALFGERMCYPSVVVYTTCWDWQRECSGGSCLSMLTLLQENIMCLNRPVMLCWPLCERLSLTEALSFYVNDHLCFHQVQHAMRKEVL